MPVLIISTDEPGEKGAALAEIEAWFAARRRRYRILPPKASGLLALAGEASALVAIGGSADAGARQLSQLLWQVPAGSLSGKPFLWFQGPAAAAGCSLGGLWLALQHAGIETVLKPVVFAAATGSALSVTESRQLGDGLVALDEGISFCLRLQRKRTSLELSERFALASLLA